MRNLEVSRIFREIAKILEIKGDNPFRIRVYERAAQNIEGLTQNLEDFIKEDRLTDIPGIGKDLSNKIKELVRAGRLKAYESLKKTIPAGLLDLLNIPSVGPKTAKLLYEKLKVKHIAGLEQAIKENKLEGIFGIKRKTVENIYKGIELLKRQKERMTLSQAIQVADEFVNALKRLPEVKKISFAGSLRRQKETVRDIDILVISDNPEKIMNTFVNLPLVKEILAKGQTKSSIRTKDDVQVDCRVVEEKSFGAALLYFTGSKNFNIKLRQLAIRKGLKINEYGVFSATKSATRHGGLADFCGERGVLHKPLADANSYGGRGNRFLGGKTEEDVFRILDMAYIEPELREDTGEIELAKQNNLPNLIELKDLKGDLHVHSKWSDGGNTILELVGAAQKKGYSYIAITDHSQSLKVASGLSPADLKKKRQEIDKINKNLKGFKVLYGTEVDIDSDGKIDYKEELLKEFDIVVAAIHSGFKQSKLQLTTRLIKACQNKYVHILAHPTGRLWGSRDAYEIDFEELLKVAKGTNTHFEINAFPQRLDLNDVHSFQAKEMGVKLVLSTDAHTTEQLDTMKLGISVARRAWLTREDIINTLSVEELLKAIKK